MLKTDIILSLKTYYNDNPKLVYYKKCISKMNEQNDVISKISSSPELLESIRIELLTNNYHIYLSNKKQNNCSFRKIKLDDNAMNRYLHQVCCISKFNNILQLTEQNIVPELNLKRKDKLKKLYIIISKNNISDLHELKNIYELSGYICGLATFEMIKYQHMDRIIDFINNGGDSLVKYTYLDKYLLMQQTYPWQEREKMLVTSGAVFETVGLTYTRDIDMLYITEKEPVEAIEIARTIKTLNRKIDLIILASDNSWYNKEGDTYAYQKTWLTYQMPQLGRASDIFEVLCNPLFNMSFMGIKFMNLDINIKRILRKSNSNSLTDLIMLEKINKYPIKDFCIPNMTLRQDTLSIFDDITINCIQHKIKKNLKKFYNYDADINDIKKRIHRCITQENYNIDLAFSDIDTGIIHKFHSEIIEMICNKYCKNVKNLLNIGMDHITNYNLMNISHIDYIEATLDSIIKASMRTTKYDVIIFQYTIQYMIDNIDNLIKNISNIANNNCIIIITCIDGKKAIHDMKMSEGEIIIRNHNKEEIFIIAPFVINNNNNNIIVYFKGKSQSISVSSIEKIVNIDILIQKFTHKHFILIDRNNFINYNTKSKTQNKISSYYASIILKYNI